MRGKMDTPKASEKRPDCEVFGCDKPAEMIDGERFLCAMHAMREQGRRK